MMRERELRTAIVQHAYGFFRIDVLIVHEPARFVSADRQDGETERTIAVARFAEMRAVAVAGIGNVENGAARRFDDEAGPQRLVAIEQTARRPMPRRHEGDSDLR